MAMTLRGASAFLCGKPGWCCTDEEMLLCGPAGTSKTVAACMWLIQGCQRFPGSQHLLCRAERASMTDTVLVTLESVIGMNHPEVRRVSREQRHSYRIYQSEIVIAGLDDPAKCFGSAYGRIVVEECIQVGLEAFELFGRAARDARYRGDDTPTNHIQSQRLCVTNPGDPGHWLNQRATREPERVNVETYEQYQELERYNYGPQDGRMRRLISVHQDNPRYFDIRRESWGWTEEGNRYLRSLNTMSGFRRARMLEGRWVSGVGDPVFDPAAVLWLEQEAMALDKIRPTVVKSGTIEVVERNTRAA